MVVHKKKIYSVRRGRGGKIQYALGNATGKQGVKWLPEKRQITYATRQAILTRQAIEKKRIAVGHASDLYIGKKKNGKEQRK